MNFISAFEELDKLYESVDIDQLKEDFDDDATEGTEEEVTEEPVEESEEEAEEEAVNKPIVLECVKCGALVIKDESEVTIDEDSDLANVGEECAYCEESEGFKAIGTFEPYVVETMDDEVAEEADAAETEDDEVFAEALTEGKIKDSIKKVATRLGADGATTLRALGELISDLMPGESGDALYNAVENIENKATLKALMSGNDKVLNGLTVDDIEELKQDIEDYKNKNKKVAESLNEGLEDKVKAILEPFVALGKLRVLTNDEKNKLPQSFEIEPESPKNGVVYFQGKPFNYSVDDGDNLVVTAGGLNDDLEEGIFDNKEKQKKMQNDIKKAEATLSTASGGNIQKISVLGMKIGQLYANCVSELGSYINKEFGESTRQASLRVNISKKALEKVATMQKELKKPANLNSTLSIVRHGIEDVYPGVKNVPSYKKFSEYDKLLSAVRKVEFLDKKTIIEITNQVAKSTSAALNQWHSLYKSKPLKALSEDITSEPDEELEELFDISPSVSLSLSGGTGNDVDVL